MIHPSHKMSPNGYCYDCDCMAPRALGARCAVNPYALAVTTAATPVPVAPSPVPWAPNWPALMVDLGITAAPEFNARVDFAAPKCDCGAAKALGAQAYASGHSSWCSVSEGKR